MANQTSTFIKKNAVTVVILAATVVLAAIAIFTAVRLYQLRQDPVAPNEPGSTPAAAAVVSASPKSGKWNQPDRFIVKNNSSQAVQLRYHLDCWDESICGDKEEQATITLAAGQTIEKGLGLICSKWQLDLNWTGGNNWDWGGIAEKAPNCGVVSPTPTMSMSPTPTASGTPKTSPTPTGSATPSGSPIACSLTFSFTLKTSSPTPTATATSTASPTPSATPTEPPRGGESPTPTPTVTSSPTPGGSTSTPKASLTPTPGIGGAATSPTPAALPAAGATLPTVLGIGAGFLLLMGAILLAL